MSTCVCVSIVTILRARGRKGDPSCATAATGLARATMAAASIEAVNAVRVANRAVVRETSALRTRITAELAAIRLSLHTACFCSLAPFIGAAVDEYFAAALHRVR